MLGTNFPYTKHLPEPGAVRVVQVDIDPTRVGQPAADRGAAGRRREQHAESVAAALIRTHDAIGRHLEKYQEPVRDWRNSMARAGVTPSATRSRRSTWSNALDELAANDAVMTCDSGTIATWAARHWHDPRRPRVLPVRQPRLDGARPAVRDRHRSTRTPDGR